MGFLQHRQRLARNDIDFVLHVFLRQSLLSKQEKLFDDVDDRPGLIFSIFRVTHRCSCIFVYVEYSETVDHVLGKQ